MQARYEVAHIFHVSYSFDDFPDGKPTISRKEFKGGTWVYDLHISGTWEAIVPEAELIRRYEKAK